MAHYDFREYLDKLEKAGELRRHDGAVDAKFEAGAIIQRLAEQGGPAIHFTQVDGGPEGATLVGGTMNRGTKFTWAKVAHALKLIRSRLITACLRKSFAAWMRQSSRCKCAPDHARKIWLLPVR